MKELIYLDATKSAMSVNHDKTKQQIKDMCHDVMEDPDLAKEMMEFYRFQKAKKKQTK